MKTKGIVLSLMASTLINIPSSFAKEYKESTQLTQAKKSKFEFYPVKLSKTQIKDGLFLDGKSYIPLTRKPALIVDDFKFQSQPGNEVSINLVLNQKESKALEQITKKYYNTKLAVIFNDRVIMVPSIKNIIGNESIKLSTSNVKLIKELLLELKQS